VVGLEEKGRENSLPFLKNINMQTARRNYSLLMEYMILSREVISICDKRKKKIIIPIKMSGMVTSYSRTTLHCGKMQKLG